VIGGVRYLWISKGSLILAVIEEGDTGWAFHAVDKKLKPMPEPARGRVEALLGVSN